MHRNWLTRLLFAPVYIRLIGFFVFTCLISAVLTKQFLWEIWLKSAEIEEQFIRLNQQIEVYQTDHIEINRVLAELSRVEQSLQQLSDQIVQVKSKEIEDWLAGSATMHQLRIVQIETKQQLTDKLGEFFRLKFTLVGSIEDVNTFLKNLLSAENLLIWEKLSLKHKSTNLTPLNLEMSIKQYLSVYD